MELVELASDLQILCHEGLSKFEIGAKVGGVSNIEIAQLKDIEIVREEERVILHFSY